MNVPRTNGMIWIDKEAPYRLKYHISDEDYTVDVSPTYLYDLGPNQHLYAGTVVKIKEADKLETALFPDDITDVLGVVLARVHNEGDARASLPISVGRTGSLIMRIEDILGVFTSSDLDLLCENGELKPLATLRNFIGAPVYWSLGYSKYTGHDEVGEATGLAYVSPIAGKLTLFTPSGFRYGLERPADEPTSFNIGYNNLPQVGTIVSVAEDRIEIQLNFSNFDTTLEWHWPCYPILEEGADVAGRLIGANVDKQDFYHGLFASQPGDLSTARTFCKVASYLYTDGTGTTLGPEYVINTSFDNIYGGNARKTTMNISCPYTMFYRVSGEVLFNIDRD